MYGRAVVKSKFTAAFFYLQKVGLLPYNIQMLTCFHFSVRYCTKEIIQFIDQPIGTAYHIIAIPKRGASVMLH